MSGARVLAVHVGAVASLPFRGRTLPSAIGKAAVAGPVGVTALGLEGDEHGDTVKHGGPDKAICVFPSEHYPAYEQRLGRPLARPAFGENLTTAGLREGDVCIGDVVAIGSALCEVSLPRNPCFRVGVRHGERRFPLWMEELGGTGFYLRVLRAGRLAAGRAIALVHRPHPGATIAEANRVMHRDKRDRGALEALLALPELGDAWRRTFTARLDGGVEDPSARRYGPVADA